MKQRKQYEVVCGIVEHEGKYLAARRSSKQHPPSLWELPGGKIEPNESLFDAIERELSEELGLQVRAIETFEPHFHSYQEFDVNLHPVVCFPITTELKIIEHESAGWFNLQELSALQWCPADIAIIQEHIIKNNH